MEEILRGLSGPYRGSRGMVLSTRGMVCSAHPLASLTGVRVLESGGNFMDAALSVSAVLNVVEPYNSHLGGDAFLLLREAGDRRPKAINASGPAPSQASEDDFAEGIPVRGIRSVSVPGQLGAWEMIHERYASLSWTEILAPAIGYAAEGFPCNVRLAQAIVAAAPTLGSDPAWSSIFLPGGRPPRVGEIFVQKDLARTLKKVAKKGPEEFYVGSLGKEIASFSRAAGGLLTLQDLEVCEAEELEPISGTYRGFRIYEQPPVSQGHILLEELNIIEGYDLVSREAEDPDVIHLMVEVKKLAFADRRAYAGDPERTEFSVDDLISKGWAAERRRLIDPKRAAETYAPGSTDDHDTTYFAVADGEGNSVSFIQSLFHGFGSGVVVPGTGVLLNNRMKGFSLDPKSPNRLEGGKRTIHTLNTYMIFDGNSLLFVGGTPGGDKQVQTNLQVVTHLLDRGMNVQEAAEYPRWSSGEGLSLSLERRFPDRTVEGLRQHGHDVNLVGPWEGGGAVQLIMIHPISGALIGGSDPRCDGCAIGL